MDMSTKHCEVCGKVAVINIGVFGFCSHEHRVRFANIIKDEIGGRYIDNKKCAKKNVRKYRKCKSCGKPTKNKIYCSNKCSSNARRKLNDKKIMIEVSNDEYCLFKQYAKKKNTTMKDAFLKMLNMSIKNR